MQRFFFTLLTALCLPFSAQADQQLDRITANWQKWVSDAGVTQSTISVARNGKIILSDGIGTDAQTVMPMASLGKAITAACAAAAIKDGHFTYSDTVSALIGNTIKITPNNADITVGQLLSHGSSLAPDQTQRPMQKWIGNKQPKHKEATQTALARTGQQSTANTYYYNNENYAILGHIIEQKTGQSYGTYCASKVLAPLGITTANLKTIYGPFAAFGGWAMTADDYTRFINGTFAPTTNLGANPERFPNTALNAKVNYGMGTFWREHRDNYNYWHFGLLCFGDQTSGGSYFAYYEGKLSVVITHNKCTDWNTNFALDGAMVRAVFNR